jgi:hypothetical protein
MENDFGHTHKFKRILKDGRKTSEFACLHPQCSYVRDARYLVNKMAACGYCGKDFIITPEMARRQGILHCKGCYGPNKDPNAPVKKKPVVSELEESLSNLFGRATE